MWEDGRGVEAEEAGLLPDCDRQKEGKLCVGREKCGQKAMHLEGWGKRDCRWARADCSGMKALPSHWALLHDNRESLKQTLAEDCHDQGMLG